MRRINDRKIATFNGTDYIDYIKSNGVATVVRLLGLFLDIFVHWAALIAFAGLPSRQVDVVGCLIKFLDVQLLVYWFRSSVVWVDHHVQTR